MDDLLTDVLTSLFRGKWHHCTKGRKAGQAIIHYRPEVIIETAVSSLMTDSIVKLLTLLSGSHYGIKPPPFYILQPIKEVYLSTCEQYIKYPWIKVLEGAFLEAKECKNFLKNDELIKNWREYPEVTIGSGWEMPKKVRSGVINQLLPAIFFKKPFFILNPAQGTGYLEFQTIVKKMRSKRYHLWFKGLNSINHWRSVLYIENHLNEGWEILARTDEWLLVSHWGSSGNPNWCRY
jgi:hypothetical protein